jgi:ATP-dependent metalloprotease
VNHIPEVGNYEEVKPMIIKILSQKKRKAESYQFIREVNEKLDNVRGINEVREEIEQVIRMIKNPEKYTEAGARLHKGILLVGKPGTGKTLIARAIAGEADVNFISLTGSDFDEMFVGIGASRIKKLFKQAKLNKPCIIFIDEIDALLAASRRGSHEHSSSRSTINQFLSEMDGFNKMEGVFLIGATNHEKDLDKAAVRAGRFDKKIHINIPDEEGRTEILDFYLKKINIPTKNLSSSTIAKMTPGFSGAEIENLVNLSITSAITSGKKLVTLDDIGEARDRILMGISRKYYKASDKRRYLTALHESGHTLVCYKNDICRKQLHKLTIIPRGPAEGVTFRLHNEDALNSKEEFIADIDMAMGGHVAEELMYGEGNMTAGCSSDLSKATQVAQSMVKKLGMYSDSVGYIYVGDKDRYSSDKFSEKYKETIDDTVKIILKESHDRVYELLTRDADELKKLAQGVFMHDTLECIFFLFS